MKIASLLFAALLGTAPAFANTAKEAPAAAAEAADTVEAEVRKVDLAAGKITLKHGELKNLGMMAMTMVFNVADKAALETVKQGDRVTATIEKVRGAYTVTRIEAAK